MASTTKVRFDNFINPNKSMNLPNIKFIILGEWKEGLMDGEGEYTWPDGKKYVGGWKSGKMFGKGKMTVNGKTKVINTE